MKKSKGKGKNGNGKKCIEWKDSIIRPFKNRLISTEYSITPLSKWS